VLSVKRACWRGGGRRGRVSLCMKDWWCGRDEAERRKRR